MSAVMNEDSTAGVQANVPATYNDTVEKKELKFRFRKDKTGGQRPEITLEVLVPSVKGIVDIVNAGGKGLELLQESMLDTVRSVVLGAVNDDENLTAANFDVSKYTWDAIANQEKTDRRSSSIPTELWEQFFEDYIATMPGVTNKTVQQITNATIIFSKKFAIVKTNKPVLKQLQDQLNLYLQHSHNAEQFVDIIELLLKKAETYLNSDSVEALVGNL